MEPAKEEARVVAADAQAAAAGLGSVVVLDGSTVRDFAMDAEAFNPVADELFLSLDQNGDGVLSRAEIRPAFERLNLVEMHFGGPVTNTAEQLNALYDSVFEAFDTDHNNTVDLSEFRSQLKDIFLAIADGLGFAPLTMVLEPGSLLENAVDHETSTHPSSSSSASTVAASHLAL